MPRHLRASTIRLVACAVLCVGLAGGDRVKPLAAQSARQLMPLEKGDLPPALTESSRIRFQFDNDTATTLPDQTTVEIPFVVSAIAGAIEEVTASFYIQHTGVGDLAISLVAPDNTVVDLTIANGEAGRITAPVVRAGRSSMMPPARQLRRVLHRLWASSVRSCHCRRSSANPGRPSMAPGSFEFGIWATPTTAATVTITADRS